MTNCIAAVYYKSVIQGVYFDFGGTLVTDESDLVAHSHIYDQLIHEFEIKTSPKEIDRKVREKVEEALINSDKKWKRLIDAAVEATREVLKQNGIIPSSADDKKIAEIYIENHARFLELFPGVIETLEFLSKTGVHLGIISDIDTELLIRTLRYKNILKYFDSITTSEEVGVGKPNPRIFEVALSKSGLKPEECVYIGNSIRNDVIGSKRMGMISIFLGSNPDVDPDYVVSNYEEIKRILEKLIKGGSNGR